MSRSANQTDMVEVAVRTAVDSGTKLFTPVRSDRFEVASVEGAGVMLLLGGGRHKTLIPWTALEGVPEFLGERLTTRIGGSYSTNSDPDTLDGYMKMFVNRATAGWVAALVERAGVVVVDPERLASVRLRPEFRRGLADQRTH